MRISRKFIERRKRLKIDFVRINCKKGGENKTDIYKNRSRK